MKRPQPFYRPKKKRWYVQLDGKHVNLGPDEQRAWAQYHEIMAERAKSPPPKPRPATPGILVVSVLDAFLDWLHNRVTEGTKAKRTFEWYRRYLQSFAAFATVEYRIADLPVAQLEPIHVYQWADSHAGWTTGKRGAMTAVQRAFTWAGKAGLLKSLDGKSPLAALEKPAQGRREQLVSEEEYLEVLSAVPSPEARDLIELSWETGMRPHELFTAEARFFDPASARLVFPVKLSKGKKVQRVVYLGERALAIVRRAAAAHPIGPMLRNTEGDPWNGAAVNCLFQRVRRELGRRTLLRLGLLPPKLQRLTAVERGDREKRTAHEYRVLERRRLIHRLAWEHGTKYSLYAFRHAFCTEALENGLDAVTVSVLMGHRDTTMISRVYSHLTQRQEHLRDAANRVRGA
jgi:integrase